MSKNNFERAKWVPIVIVAIILMLIWNAIDNIGHITTHISDFLSIISPLLYGILFTYFIYTPHKFIEKLLRKVKIKLISNRARGLSTVITFIFIIALLILIILFVIPILFTSVIDLANSIPNYVNQLLDFMGNLPEDSFWADLDIEESIREFSSGIMTAILNTDWLTQAAGTLIDVGSTIFSIILGLVISLYILHDRNNITNFFIRLNKAIFKSERKQVRLKTYIVQANRVLFTFIASKGLDSLINFTVATTVLLILNVPYALLLGIVAGVLNFIPFLGSFISAVIISLIALVTRTLDVALIVMISLLVFNQLDANFIEPRIMKSSLKISPILVIVTVVAGGAYFGIIGMFLAVPITVVAKQLVIEYIDFTEKSFTFDVKEREIVSE